VVFASVPFLFYFLPLFMAAYFLTPTIWWKNLTTVAFSLIFYAWGEPRLVVILIASICGNAFAAVIIERLSGRARKLALALAVAGNLSLLGAYKYANFLAANLDVLLGPIGLHVPPPGLPLPLGISFFTFHCLSYLIDVYRGRFAANRNPLEIALYISLFPQLIAGPIVRYNTIARQLRARRHSLARASAGCRIFIIGLAQKVLVADTVATLVRQVFDASSQWSIADAWVGLVAYTLQIYFDFSGYSNMAVGLGLCLGFSLPRNFRLPYSSRSITEFWRRWHMSLSSWLRDYLYIPLGGNRGSAAQTYRNLVTVFLLCGLWHGASWNFLLWGAWHGTFLVIERAGFGRWLDRLPDPVRLTYTLLAVMGGWVLFRSHDVHAAAEFYASLLGLRSWSGLSLNLHFELQPDVLLAIVVGSLLAVVRKWPGARETPAARTTRPALARAVATAIDGTWTFGLLLLSMLVVASGAYSPFLYFRF
jgi:alginate O-acetyltransferase complex protein AlgI